MADAPTPEQVRVTLLAGMYAQEYGGRLEAGTAVLVDPATAARWKHNGIAVDAKESDRTAREKKLAELERLRAELGDDDDDAADAGGAATATPSPQNPAPSTQDPVRSYPARASRATPPPPAPEPPGPPAP